MELLYKAIDGEIFNTKEECEDYEIKLEAKNFNKDLERILYLTSDNGIISFIPIEKVEYFCTHDICYIPDEAALRAIKTLRGFRHGNAAVGYNYRVYCGDYDDWSQDRIEELVEECNELNKEIEILEGEVMLIENEISKRKKESF